MDLIHRSLRSCHRCQSSSTIFALGSIPSHLILRTRCLLCCHRSIKLCSGFIQFLCRYYTLFIQILESAMGFLGNGNAGLGLLPHFQSSLHLLLTSSTLHFSTDSLRRLFCTSCLFEFGQYFRRIQFYQSVSGFYPTAFFYIKGGDSSRYLARHSIFSHFYLTLYHFSIASQG